MSDRNGDIATITVELCYRGNIKEMLARFSEIPVELRARPKDFTRPKSCLSGKRLV